MCNPKKGIFFKFHSSSCDIYIQRFCIIANYFTNKQHMFPWDFMNVTKALYLFPQ